MVQVFEAWRLPSYEGAGDGYHAIILQDCTLAAEPYEKDYFPFAVYSYQKKPLGFYGESIASMLFKNQMTINRILKIIDKSILMFAYPKIWAPPGSNFNPDKYTRGFGDVVESTVQPQIMVQQIIPQEVYTHLTDIYQKSFEVVGISQQTAAAKKQARTYSRCSHQRCRRYPIGSHGKPNAAIRGVFR